METLAIGKKSVEAYQVLYDLHSQLFLNVIQDFSEEDANNRMNTKANHPSWLAGSLVQERFETAGILGRKLKPTFDDLFNNHKGIQDNVKYPALNRYVDDWNTITPILKEELQNITEEQLEQVFEMPDMKFSVADMIVMLIHREPYCIGQIALYRRLMGYNAMKYPF